MLSLVPLGISGVVNTYVNGLQQTFSQTRAPAVAVDGNGETVVVWASKDQDSSGFGVYGQRLDAGGGRLGEEFQINTTTNRSQTFPSVAMDEDGDFVVTWSSLLQDGGGYGVYARRYSAAGAAQGGEFRINQHTPGNQNFSSVAMDEDGDFVVVWTSSDQDGDVTGVYARCFDADGTVTGNEFLVNTTTQGNQRQADVSMDAAGGFFVVWNSQNQDGSSGGIFGRRFQFDATPLGDEIAVNTTTAGNQQFPDIDIDASGAVVAWQSSNAGVWKVYAQRFDAQGNAAGDELFVATGRTASVTKGTGNDFVVAWETDDASETEILAQHFGPVGQPWGTTVSLSGVDSGRQSAVSIARTDLRLVAIHTEIPAGGSGIDKDVIATYLDIVPDESLNEPPQIDEIADQTINEMALHELTATAVDPDGNVSELVYSFVGSPPSGMAIDPASGLLSWTPTEVQGPGVYAVSVRVTDAGSSPLSDVTSFWITVDEVNLPPQIDDIEPQTTDQNEEATVTVTAVDDDLPANGLTFSLDVDAPVGAVIDASSGLFTWTPDTDVVPGDYEITVTVTDDGDPFLSDSGTLAVRVEPALMESIADQTISEFETLIIELLPSGGGEFAESVTLSLDATTVEGVAFDPATNEFSWTPNELQGLGTYQFTVRASDPDNYTIDDIETFTVNVTEGNSPPVLGPFGGLWSRRGETVSSTIPVFDPDLPTNALTFSLGGDAPIGAVIDASSGVFSWTPDTDVLLGAHEITVTVTDDGDPSLSDSAVLLVSIDLAIWQYIPGDANIDGTVDDADATIVAGNWQKTSPPLTWTDGDFNGDGGIDDIDATIMAANWGSSASLPGDANRDLTVDDADATIVAGNWQKTFLPLTWSDGDFNSDGRVDDIDATIMAANWGSTVSLPGDANRDGTVDNADSAIVAANWQKNLASLTWTDGDFNGDGRVDDIDATIMAANWGSSVSLPGDANRDGTVDDADATIVAGNWQKTSVPLTWTDGDFNGDGRIDDIDATIMAANWGRTLFLPGDANIDGTVDDADATILAGNWQMQTGAAWYDGDFNNDGRVDDIDATIMAANWGQTLTSATASSSAATEPEVETLSLEPATVSYDLDNDGRIGLGDLAHFASVYRERPGITTESPYAYAADFDRSGTVDLGDLALFAANYQLSRPTDSLAYPTEVSQSSLAAPVAALTMAAPPAILPGDANRDGSVDDDDAATLALNWQKQTAATWAQGDFNSDGLVNDADAMILARHWMMTVEDLDDDDARDSIFATIGATDVLFQRI